ncbi:maltose alpha-D-glucosyltransferase/ alpha-amylase [Desulfonatronum thiosulfatophilum]|uniref:Maltokinase n=1 Tax=Desulfonatronum thiosulfatophilum TaxID=617002 RepID=A0A1G6DHZ1_9BACT|nr:maltose alpha-D-glucosyltransferase [Desulfonatronum thiosulfatophilum]SDB44752.1 maltose alpha-D-glucosyltransferase/ alpha-amylase [Desulfonatronum thiosulfatophilum]
MSIKQARLIDDPLWYKDAIIYEVHIKAFFDSNSDGIGDLPGLTQKLDYLADLGITAIWLLPFYPSPLRDDGYDIADYFSVHPQYGTIKDFKFFLREAHKRGLRVITELVLNHTSDQHPWFQRARNSPPGSSWRNFYVWSDTQEKYQDARIIFKDFETSNWTWDPVAKAYYWHRFYSHQPDLNFDNPQVGKALFRVIDYWLKMGVDGMRLDAVPYLYEREGTNCENLPETHKYLQDLRAHIDAKYPNRMLLAEANQWPEDACAYFGSGNSCQMAFHFPLMPRLFMALHMEESHPIIDIFEQTPAIPDNCQWAFFLRNHDELTLEMVTDEERDYMYRMYARDPRARINLGIRRRLAPLLDNDRKKINLLNAILFAMPGSVVLYYGDELGMGDNYYLGDRDGVRTPMQWSSDRNAGFSRANPQKLYLPVIIDPEYHFEAINVETQSQNQASLLWWNKRFISMYKRFQALGRGDITFLRPDNAKVLAFIRRYEDEHLLIVANLSRHCQPLELELQGYAGWIPEEVFSRNRFPAVQEGLYSLTLGSYGYYFFQMIQVADTEQVRGIQELPLLTIRAAEQDIWTGEVGERLEKRILPRFLPTRRWFRSKARKIQQVTIKDVLDFNHSDQASLILILSVDYVEGAKERYVLPLTMAWGEDAKAVAAEEPQHVLSRLSRTSRNGEEQGILFEAVYAPDFAKRLIKFLSKRQHIKGRRGELHAWPGRDLRQREIMRLEPHLLRTEQSNSSLNYGNELILKIYRQLERGQQPELELCRFLTERTTFRNFPLYAGSLTYNQRGVEDAVLGVLQQFVPSHGDAWKYSHDALQRYVESVLSLGPEAIIPQCPCGYWEAAHGSTQEAVIDLIGPYLEMIALLGRRTAELHIALASRHDDPAFAPEPFSYLYQRSIFQGLQNQLKTVMSLLRKNLKRIPEEQASLAREVLETEKAILERFRTIYSHKILASKIRIHGDYHLAQALYTGKDFVIIDFEGEPARALSERRLKRSALRDVAGMLRSFDYLAQMVLRNQVLARETDKAVLTAWIDAWSSAVSGMFLKSYLDLSHGHVFLPDKADEVKNLLDIFVLDKAVYELGYELNNRLDWVDLPLKGLKNIMEVQP